MRSFIQLEDCVDILQILLPQYNYVFLFDHSSGYTKKKRELLDARTMNKYFGVNQTHQITTVISRKSSYLGTHHDETNPNMVQVGETQKMIFKNKHLTKRWTLVDECR